MSANYPERKDKGYRLAEAAKRINENKNLFPLEDLFNAKLTQEDKMLLGEMNIKVD